ncbi:hypothetical protein WICMUC_001223 [Wickerhamomyces mucosus]|uniref:Uncharacterized protein n=1 Tax=Wickerhamomyces mucosus TaxID=1378264 RepID=A0A9P8PVC1_9ASCO|nr:hypothetical protein WICMUC_001223 [Wickerhamomyces mucosus]
MILQLSINSVFGFIANLAILSSILMKSSAPLASNLRVSEYVDVELAPMVDAIVGLTDDSFAEEVEGFEVWFKIKQVSIFLKIISDFNQRVRSLAFNSKSPLFPNLS